MLAARIFLIRSWLTLRSVAASLIILVLGTSLCEAQPDFLLAPVSNEEVSKALEQVFIPPESFAPLRENDHAWSYAVATNRERLRDTMRALGYLDGDVNLAAGAAASANDQVRFEPILGPRYRIGAVIIEGILGSDLSLAAQKDIPDILQKYPGEIAQAVTLARIEDDVLWRIRKDSHPFARVISREVAPDHGAVLANVSISVEPGHLTRLGTVDFIGLRRLSPGSLVALIPFKPGENYEPEKIDAFRQALMSVSAIHSVDIDVADQPDEVGRVDITVNVREENPEQLLRLGLVELLVFAATLVALAIRQVALATNERLNRRPLRFLTVCVSLLVMASLIIAVRHVITFVNG